MGGWVGEGVMFALGVRARPGTHTRGKTNEETRRHAPEYRKEAARAGARAHTHTPTRAQSISLLLIVVLLPFLILLLLLLLLSLSLSLSRARARNLAQAVEGALGDGLGRKRLATCGPKPS